jgi:hypothetical protein
MYLKRTDFEFEFRLINELHHGTCEVDRCNLLPTIESNQPRTRILHSVLGHPGSHINNGTLDKSEKMFHCQVVVQSPSRV